MVFNKISDHNQLAVCRSISSECSVLKSETSQTLNRDTGNETRKIYGFHIQYKAW